MVTEKRKRRLPVIQAPAEDMEVPRPTWQWVLLGAGMELILWLTLASLVLLAFARWMSVAWVSTLVHSLTLVSASAITGLWLGKSAPTLRSWHVALTAAGPPVFAFGSIVAGILAGEQAPTNAPWLILGGGLVLALSVGPCLILFRRASRQRGVSR